MIIKEDITLSQLAELTAWLASEQNLIHSPAKPAGSNAQNSVCENFGSYHRGQWIETIPFATLQRTTSEEGEKMTVTLKVTLSYGVNIHPNNTDNYVGVEQEVRTADSYILQLMHILQPIRA